MDSVDKMTMIPVFDSVEQPFLPVSVQLPWHDNHDQRFRK